MTDETAVKNALITGSTQGIGLEIARAFAERGCNVGICGLAEAERIQRIVGELSAISARDAGFFEANLKNPDETVSMVNNFVERFGSIDILVNNAGIQHVSPVVSFPEHHWDAIIAVNLSSVYHATISNLIVST